MKEKTCFLVISIMFFAILSGCTEKQQQPSAKTIEDMAVDIVTLIVERNYTGVYSFF